MQRLLRMLYCGHGDTIVLHLPGGRCCLIDCNLKTVSTRDNLFHFFASNKVDRLEFVALSHYDSDHYWGMAEVLDYFTSEGRSIGCVYLPPLNHKYALSIIKAPDVRQPSEATQLQRLDDRLSSGKFQISYVTSGHERFLFQGRDFDFHFLALAPDAKSDHRIVVAGYKRFAKNLDVDVSPGDVNALSAVWAVYIRNKVKPAKSLVLLLAGDLSEEEWIWALDAWRRKSSECGCPSQFRAVKIPHHGSFNSHSEELLDFLPSEGSRYGLISVGTDFPSLPDRRVVEAYLNRGVEVATTFRRTALSRPRAINILDVARRRFCGEGVCNDIVGVLGAEGEVAFSPPEAFIKRTELGLYDTSNG